MPPKDITRRIIDRLAGSLLSEKVVDNTIRGLWCEFMIAEALGATCKTVGLGWNAWDLQLGPDSATFPERIRVQVKNSARLQIWHKGTPKVSDCAFNLFFRRRPKYLREEVPCEAAGFLCEMFILCHHDECDWKLVNQLDPAQWRFYLVPVVGPNSAVTDVEKAWAAEKLDKSGKHVACIRRPETLESGIRQRPAVQPLRYEQLSVAAIREALGMPAS